MAQLRADDPSDRTDDRRQRRRRHLSVGKKILLLSVMVGVIFASVGAIGFVQSRRLTAQLDQQSGRDVVALSEMTTVGEALGEQHSAVLSHVLSDPGFYRDTYTKKIGETDATINRELAALDALALTPEERNEVNSLKALLPAWRRARDQALQASNAGDRAKATSMVLVRSQAIGEALQNRVGEVVGNLDRTVATGAEQARSSSANSAKLVVFALVGSVLLAAGLSVLVARTIARPLRQAVTVLRRVEDGDFSRRLEVRTHDEVGEMAHSLNRTLDVLQDSFATMRHRASHDSLTGLANRALFHERVGEALGGAAGAKASGDTAILLIDLNDFKLVNDMYGHAAGDALLIEVARRLRQRLRPGDTAARLGGDEFAVLLRSAASTTEVRDFAEELSRTISRPVTVNGTALQPLASIGIAPWREQHSIDEFLHEADLAMYAVKVAGRRSTAAQPTQSPSPTDPA